MQSLFSQVFKAMRGNEPQAIPLDYNVPKYKLTACVLSAALSNFKALVFKLESLADTPCYLSGKGVLMTLVGSMYRIFCLLVDAVLQLFFGLKTFFKQLIRLLHSHHYGALVYCLCLGI